MEEWDSAKAFTEQMESCYEHMCEEKASQEEASHD